MKCESRRARGRGLVGCLTAVSAMGCGLPERAIYARDGGGAGLDREPNFDAAMRMDMVEMDALDATATPDGDEVAVDVVDVPVVTDTNEDAVEVTDAKAHDDASVDVDDAVGTADAGDVPAVMDVPVEMDLPGAMDVPVAMDAWDVPSVMDVHVEMDHPVTMDVPVGMDTRDAPAMTDVVDVIDAGQPVFDSCEAVRLTLRPSGAYLIRAGSISSWLAYCDTSDTMGAWTLVLKADGRLRTFAYDAALWTNTTLLNESSANLDAAEAKFAGFLSLPARAVRLQLVTPATAGFSMARGVVLDGLSGAPLQRVFQEGGYVNLEGRTNEAFWEALIVNSRMQDRCNRRGFNARAGNGGAARVRIGMIGNENRVGECDSHDSWIGVGGANGSCGGADSNTVGNVACHAGGGNDRDLRAFAYVWIR